MPTACGISYKPRKSPLGLTGIARYLAGRRRSARCRHRQGRPPRAYLQARRRRPAPPQRRRPRRVQLSTAARHPRRPRRLPEEGRQLESRASSVAPPMCHRPGLVWLPRWRARRQHHLPALHWRHRSSGGPTAGSTAEAAAQKVKHFATAVRRAAHAVGAEGQPQPELDGRLESCLASAMHSPSPTLTA